jgi:hypothetical protein
MELVIHEGRFLLSSVIDVILLLQSHTRHSVSVFRNKIAALELLMLVVVLLEVFFGINYYSKEASISLLLNLR